MKEQLMKNIGVVLKETRKSMLKTVEDVSSETKINKDTIYKYERGNGKDLLVISTLLDNYGINFSIFFRKVYAKCHNE